LICERQPPQGGARGGRGGGAAAWRLPGGALATAVSALSLTGSTHNQAGSQPRRSCCGSWALARLARSAAACPRLPCPTTSRNPCPAPLQQHGPAGTAGSLPEGVWRHHAGAMQYNAVHCSTICTASRGPQPGARPHAWLQPGGWPGCRSRPPGPGGHACTRAAGRCKPSPEPVCASAPTCAELQQCLAAAQTC
jgi:hypothetical protein